MLCNSVSFLIGTGAMGGVFFFRLVDDDTTVLGRQGFFCRGYAFRGAGLPGCDLYDYNSTN